MVALLEPTLRRLYIDEKRTDKQISEMFNLDRTYIVHLRKRYGIAHENKLAKVVRGIESHLKQLGFDVENLYEHNRISDIDLLISGNIRIDVMRGTLYEGKFYCSLTSKEGNRHIESETRFQLKNGRFRKRYDLTCDYLICCGVDGNGTHYWVIPSCDIPETLQSICLNPNSPTSKYAVYEEAWHLISGVQN